MGYGARLNEGFERVTRLPALYESRRRFEAAVLDGRSDPRDIAETVASDLGLATAVLRSANHPHRGRSAQIGTLHEAVTMLPRTVLLAIGERVATHDVFDRSPVWDVAIEQCRIHAVSTQVFAGRIAALLGSKDRDELLVAALLHDVGKLVLREADPSYPFLQGVDTESPEERLMKERRGRGIDHPAIGAILIRKWNLPVRLAQMVAQHHNPDAGGAAGILRLADMLAHYHAAARVGPGAMSRAAARVGLSPTDLRAMLATEPPGSHGLHVAAHCPLSPRELGVLRGIAAGGVYQDVANSMGVSASTVRSHLANAARKIGVRDRAQAVLAASERGWL